MLKSINKSILSYFDCQNCLSTVRLGRCFSFQGRGAQAAAIYRQAIAEGEQLPASDSVKRQIGILLTNLGDALTDMGDYDEARIAYEESNTSAKELGDARGEAIVNTQLGSLALVQGKLAEAEESYQEALKIFQRLNEPATEAIAWHQLGMVYQKARQWDAAEGAYRESARIKESLGHLAGAAQTWNQLAVVNEGAGKLEAAEAWYRKAIKGFKDLGDRIAESKVCNNLADLLQNQDRLSEAQQLAEEALAIDKTLDPAVAEIWKIYNILAEIADKQGDITQAREYRRLSRQEYAQFAGMPYHLQQYEDVIAMVVAAVDNPEVRQKLEAFMEQQPEGSANTIAAIRAILEGERDAEVLCEPLNYGEAAIVSAILRGIGERF